VERVLVSLVCTLVVSSEAILLGVVGSDWTIFNVASSSREISMMRGDGCLGLGIRCEVNEAVDKQRGDMSQLLVLKSVWSVS